TKRKALTKYPALEVALVEDKRTEKNQHEKSNFEHKYPLLVKLAIKLLSIPTLSALAKRNWSQFGFIYSKFYARLDNNKVKKLVAVSQKLRIQKNIVED
ncbi:7696_t:CDS:2, partial [Scutellospora calospora]